MILKFLTMEAGSFTLSKVVFLDRDGVINEKAAPHDYIKNWKEFTFLPETIRAIHLLNNHGFVVVLVTNQRGIARGLMTMDNLNIIHQNMQTELSAQGAHIDRIYVCPHDKGTCHCRKPEIGLFLQAQSEYNIDKNHSYMVGDSVTDIQAGKKFGISTISINGLNYGADYDCSSLMEAAKWIIREEEK